MCLSKLSLLLFLGTIVASSVAHDDGVVTPAAFVASHNAFRAKKGLPPLVWDPAVAAYAEHSAHVRSDCQLIHSHGKYGENLAWSSDPNFSAATAVGYWVGEEPYYDYGSNSCTHHQACLHYTQVMWRNSKRLGCGVSRCPNGGRFITCNYDPPGNYIGQKPF